ncbi:hypothetical protein LBMAG42_13950 [Deltaproteobacteria bacterium]|nr:hypothetical protein LBMAG42_13950 [Deltaproteobacteria bacterium]
MSTSKKGFDPLASLFDLPETPPVASPAAPPAKGDALPEASHVKPAAPVVPPLSGPDPAALAKILARAAVARAGAPKPAPGGATLVPEGKGAAAAEAPKPAAKAAKPATPAAAAASPMSRLMAAPPPRKTVSAEEAMRLAGEDESRRRAEAATVKPVAPPAGKPAASPAPPAQVAAAVSAATAPAASATPMGDISDVVGGIIQDSLPELGAVYIAKALVMDDRGVLTALWRAHRARFGSTGDVAGAVAVSAVLRALAAVRPGQLAVAHAVTDKSDWLIWVDLSTSTTIAGFKDARAWFAGA